MIWARIWQLLTCPWSWTSGLIYVQTFVFPPLKSEVYRFCPFSLPLRNIFHHRTTLACSSEWWVIPTPHPRQCELLFMVYGQENKISSLFVLRSEWGLALVLVIRIEYMPTAHINNCVINNIPPPLWEEAYSHVLVTQSCLTLCSSTDCSPLGSSAHGILQARILEWLAIPFSRGSSWPRGWTLVSCIAGRFFTIWATWKSCTSMWEHHIFMQEGMFSFLWRIERFHLNQKLSSAWICFFPSVLCALWQETMPLHPLIYTLPPHPSGYALLSPWVWLSVTVIVLFIVSETPTRCF